MDMHRAFLDDIIAHPDDDTPRLIYADWLDDNGDPSRAEFIRLQVDRGRGLSSWESTAREQELLNEHANRWTTSLLGRVHSVEFCRGFIEAVHVTAAEAGRFRLELSSLCLAFPLRRLRLDAPTDDFMNHLVDRIATGELHLEQLDLDLDQPEASWFERLLGLPQAARFRSLLIEHEHASTQWNRLLARLDQPGPFTQLTELGIGFGTTNDPIYPEVIEQLIASPYLSRLKKLHIPFSWFGVDGMRLLAHSPIREGLTHLDVGCCHIPLEGWKILAEGPALERLEWLGLIGAHVMMAESWQNLREHEYGRLLTQRLKARADYTTSSTFVTRQKGVPVK